MGYALQEAAARLGNNWIYALSDGFKGDLVKDVSELVTKLHAFQEKAREVLPVGNGGFGGIPKSRWIEELSLASVFVYEAEDLPGHFGFTGCDADDFMSFEEALRAALIANPDVVKGISDQASATHQSEQPHG